MFYLNWRFTLIALSVAPVLFIVVYSFTHRIKAATREVRKKESEIVSVVQEALSSMRVVKAFARERYEERRLEKESLESVQIVLRARAIKARLSPAVDIIVAAGTCLVLWYGVRLVLSGSLTSGELLVFLLYLGKMCKPMRDLSKMTDTLSRAGVGFARVGEVLDAEVRVRDLPGARRAPLLKGAIEFDHVNFSYDERCASLKDISFRVEPGQFAAIVGPTGGGKSTLLNSPRADPQQFHPDSRRANIGTRRKVEKTISEALRKLMSGRTSIVAAHRLSTIAGADVIFVVKDAIERGTHSDLVRLGGLYAELYETQLRSGESSERSYGSREEERHGLSNFKSRPALAKRN